jgi:hypothetical protein
MERISPMPETETVDIDPLLEYEKRIDWIRIHSLTNPRRPSNEPKHAER